jgi:hypothetical protein
MPYVPQLRPMPWIIRPCPVPRGVSNDLHRSTLAKMLVSLTFPLFRSIFLSRDHASLSWQNSLTVGPAQPTRLP